MPVVRRIKLAVGQISITTSHRIRENILPVRPLDNPVHLPDAIYVINCNVARMSGKGTITAEAMSFVKCVEAELRRLTIHFGEKKFPIP